MPQQEDEQQFTDILLLLIAIECLVSLKECIKYVESYSKCHNVSDVP